MSEENDNKAVVGRWFAEFWGKTCDLTIVDEIAAPDMLLKYSLHEPRRGHADIKAFPGSLFLGNRGSYLRGRLRRRTMGRWRHPYRPRVQ